VPSIVLGGFIRFGGDYSLLRTGLRIIPVIQESTGNFIEFTMYSVIYQFYHDVNLNCPKIFTDTTSPLPAPLSMLPRPFQQVLPGRLAWPRGRPPTRAAAHHH